VRSLVIAVLSLAACSADVAVSDDAVDVGVVAEALTYEVINSNGGYPLSSEASHKKAALRGYVMQWGSQGFSCQFNCPDGTICSATSGGCDGTTVKLTNCHNDETPYHTFDRICNVIQNGSYWGFMRYCQGSGSECQNACFSWVDQDNTAHNYGCTFIPNNHFNTP